MISLSDYAATNLLSVVAVFYAAALYNSLLGCLMNFFFVICYLLWIIVFILNFLQFANQRSRIFSDDFYLLVCRCLFHPESVGFNVTDIEILKNLPEQVLSFKFSYSRC